MTRYARLQLFSKIVRLLILLSAFLVVAGLFVEYGFGLAEIEWRNGGSDYVIDVTPDYHQKYYDLKMMEGVNLWLLSLYPLTLLSIEFLIFYWLQRLFCFYAKGQFFHEGTTQCYLILVWSGIFQFVFRFYEEYFLWLFYPDKSDVGINSNFEAGEFGILLVLLAVAYVLKIANNIDKENKEFV